VVLADFHAVPPAPVPDGSVEGWLLLAVILGALVAAGVFLTARR
jgi:hypothetical protein